MSNPKHFIFRRLGSLTRTIHAIVESELKKYGLKRGQFIYIIRICENPGINQMTLSNILKVDKTRTAKSIKKLVENEFITKERDKNDARSFLLYPTDKGQEVYKKIIKEENRQIDICFKGFDNSEKEIIFVLLSKMTDNLEEDWKNLKR
ncbi:MarR family winged helix-turn-helix transcriptional regulator [Vallitalea guaymasensis]|uniref:MarR family winged helix-turn-helix transcriptional regulator n=1 Tax=Vallitalea guaymasensis TaxID=1185412 RepID=UPI0023541B08|nr:MarR family winged helix-turn-helix transcriptional regulator [Vallitalea guaymasensis]